MTMQSHPWVPTRKLNLGKIGKVSTFFKCIASSSKNGIAVNKSPVTRLMSPSAAVLLLTFLLKFVAQHILWIWMSTIIICTNWVKKFFRHFFQDLCFCSARPILNRMISSMLQEPVSKNQKYAAIADFCIQD